jgi:hypothetical protein
MLAKRDIGYFTYNSWSSKYHAACTSLEDREKLMEEC